jgi:hypothetical protein
MKTSFKGLLKLYWFSDPVRWFRVADISAGSSLGKSLCAEPTMALLSTVSPVTTVPSPGSGFGAEVDHECCAFRRLPVNVSDSTFAQLSPFVSQM